MRGKVNPSTTPEADRHVRIAGEIEIDLDRVRNQADPRLDERAIGGLVERDLNQRRDHVGDQDLLRQTDDENARADRDAAEREPARVELPGDGLVANDRPGDQLRKEGDIESDIDGIAVGSEPPPVDVDDVREAMEGEEGDAERQGDIGLRHHNSERPEQRREIAGDEIRIFEQRKDEKVARHRDGKRHPARRALSAIDDQRRKKVEDDREQKDQDEARFSPGVEKEREQERDDVFALDRRGEEIKSQKDRQEIEQERY